MNCLTTKICCLGLLSPPWDKPEGQALPAIGEAQSLQTLFQAAVISPFGFHAQARCPRAVSLIVDFHLSDSCICLSVGSELGQGKEMILIRSPHSKPGGWGGGGGQGVAHVPSLN